jgi:hypothetical protein
MALTQGAWSVKTVNDKLVCECDVVQTTGENDAYTLKTPSALDTSKPFIVLVNTAGATLDGSALPVDIYAGFSDSFAVTGDSTTIGATDGGLVAADVIDDVKSVNNGVLVNPNYNGTKVQSTLAGARGVVNAGTPPYFAFNLDGASTLTAGTCHWVLIQ